MADKVETTEEAMKFAIDHISYYKLYIDAAMKDGDYQYLQCMLNCLIHFIEEAKEVVVKHCPHQVMPDLGVDHIKMTDEEIHRFVDECIGPPTKVPGRAETNEAKRRIIERLYNLWIQHPSLRLGQLIVNIINDKNVLYSKEDEDLTTMLEEGYNNIQSIIKE